MCIELNWSGWLDGGKGILCHLHRCGEIIEACWVPDGMLTWCCTNQFHSLIKGFVCSKGTDCALPGGMMSSFVLPCWCHMEFEWSDFSVYISRWMQLRQSVLQGFGLPHFDKQVWAPGFGTQHVGSDTGFDLTALTARHMQHKLFRNCSMALCYVYVFPKVQYRWFKLFNCFFLFLNLDTRLY